VLASVLPVVWDQSTYRGRSTVVDAMLDVLKLHGVASGFMCSLRDNRGRVAALAMSSAIPLLDDVGKLNVARNLGDMLMFQRYFHELFVTGVLNEFVPPYLQGQRLSPRELQCLKLSATGLSGEDIANKLSISPRTVQSHFDSIRSKLGAVNRQQLLHFATRSGLLTE